MRFLVMTAYVVEDMSVNTNCCLEDEEVRPDVGRVFETILICFEGMNDQGASRTTQTSE